MMMSSTQCEHNENMMMSCLCHPHVIQTMMTWCFVEFWGLPPLILFFNMSIGWFGRFVLSTVVNQNKEAWLQESKLAKMLCTGHREFGTKRWEFLSKAKHFIF